MLALTLAAIAVVASPISDGSSFDRAVPPAPAGALGLAPRPSVMSPILLPASSGATSLIRNASAPRGSDPPSSERTPWVPPPLGFAAGLAAAVSSGRRNGGRFRTGEPVYFIVHGNGGSAADFDLLLELMEIDRHRVVAFDYRSVAPGRSSTEVSRWVDTDDVARAIDAQVRDLAARYGAVYSIHHSKGAAAGVVAIAAMDDGTRPPIDGYRGAALLDPPIARSPLGTLQRLGQRFGWAPDNGGFHPVQCHEDGCRDVRAHLGDASGVEVIVVRNPDALITNFTDEPDGLRVYDLEYDGRPSAWSKWWWMPSMASRMFEAHRSVLRHRAVADCITSEATAPGSCRWDGAPRSRRWPWGSGGSRSLVR